MTTTIYYYTQSEVKGKAKWVMYQFKPFTNHREAEDTFKSGVNSSMDDIHPTKLVMKTANRTIAEFTYRQNF